MENQAIKNIMDNVVENRNKELYSIETRKEIQDKYFTFDFNKKYETQWRRLRDFVDAIELLKHFAEDWEKEKNGFSCSVDRVYQYFINPLCQKFDLTSE